jgi:hypothetical protein
VKGSSLASKPRSLVCPLCEAGGLDPLGHDSARCEFCGGSLGGATLDALREIAALPDTLGNHPCECGHPEMRRLPDGVFHCPACGCEVLPLAASEGKSARAAEHRFSESFGGKAPADKGGN